MRKSSGRGLWVEGVRLFLRDGSEVTGGGREQGMIERRPFFVQNLPRARLDQLTYVRLSKEKEREKGIGDQKIRI